MHKAVVLVVEENIAADRDHFSGWLSSAGYTVVRKSSREAMVVSTDRDDFDLVLVKDRCLHGQQNSEAACSVFLNCNVPVIAFGTPASVSDVREVLQLGVADYLFEPLAKELLNAAVDKALSQKKSRPDSSKGEEAPRPIATQSDKMHRLLEMAVRVARSDATILIAGESGTGKELLARYIHRHSLCAAGPFVDMNCAALPENLAESELFGYEKGAFTGAGQRRQGKFEAAHKGTLLLDEIGEIAPALQAKLLRVLQERQITRLGGNEALNVEVRLIAVTNCDLAQMVRRGLFREDLYYRLRVVPLTIPPLREHAEDIVLLAEHFLKRYCAAGGSAKKFTESALQSLLEWPWPGNIRELQNTVQRAVLISEGPLVHSEDLLLGDLSQSAGDSDQAAMVGQTVKEMERTLIEQTLAHVSFNRTQAARMLGISIRTLRNKLSEFNKETAVGAVM